MPLLERILGDNASSESSAIEDVTDILHEAPILDEKHNDVSAAHSYKTKLKIEARKKEEERKKKHVQTIHNTVSKNVMNGNLAVAGYSVKLANERVSRASGDLEVVK